MWNSNYWQANYWEPDYWLEREGESAATGGDMELVIEEIITDIIEDLITECVVDDKF